VIVSDAEEEIPQKNIAHSDQQLDLVHAVKESLFRMWMDGAGKEERCQLSKEMNRILYTLVNSVRKHLEDQNRKRLSQRFESTIKELSSVSKRMKRRGHLKTWLFIKSHSRIMVTFAKIALTEGVRIPHTSNAIERLMGEISKRCKHKWMHWSTKGLENMLWILLTRYTDPSFYHERFWNDYIHPSRVVMMRAT
jgi:transposase-like protein